MMKISVVAVLVGVIILLTILLIFCFIAIFFSCTFPKTKRTIHMTGLLEKAQTLTTTNLLGRKEELISCANELYDLDPELLYTSHKFPYPQIRFSIFYILRQEGYSLASIGRLFGKGHCAVIWGVSRVDDALRYSQSDEILRMVYMAINTADKKSENNDDIIFTTKMAMRDWLEGEEIDDEIKNKLMLSINKLIGP